jgi:transposase
MIPPHGTFSFPFPLILLKITEVTLMRPARAPYPTDLTGAQWRRIEPLIPRPRGQGRPRKASYREIVNAVLYVLRAGGSWRMLPHDFPHWKTVYTYFRLWRIAGVWDRIHDRLREQVREKAGREKSPSAAILDSQSVKTTEKGGSVGATTRARR